MRRRARTALFGLWLSLPLASVPSGCSEPATELPTFEHYPALSQALAEAEAAVEAARSEAPAAAEVEPEHVSGLVHMLANSSGRTRELPLEEIATLGDGAAPLLAVIAANTEHDGAERLAACELLAALGTPRATEHLLQLCEKAPEGWLRSQAAWRLAGVPHDWIVPRLAYRLKYELDEEAAIWVAHCLGAHGNYSGLEGLWSMSRGGGSEAVRAAAAERLAELAKAAGAASPEEHWELWTGTDPERRLWRAEPSPRLVRDVWRQIEQLSGEHFQLRGVDDARFILSRLGSWVTEPLSRALHDEDVYVRVHAAQCLERMGPRANRAGPVLVEALADPSVAASAAAALGRVAYPSAEPVLRRLLEDTGTDHELRVACAAALGRIGLSASIEALEGLANSSAPADLRQTSATSLVGLGVGDRAASFLLEALAPGSPDRPGAEAALGAWLAQLEDDAGREALQAWNALAPAAGAIPTRVEVEARLAARRHLLEARRGQLKGL